MVGSKIQRSLTCWTFEKEVGKIYGVLTIGASGAVSSFDGGGILNIVKESTDGQYSITLAAGFQRLLMVQAMSVAAANSTVASVQILETPANLQSDFKSDRTFAIQCSDFAGADVNPASGEALLLEITVRMSPIGPFD